MAWLFAAAAVVALVLVVRGITHTFTFGHSGGSEGISGLSVPATAGIQSIEIGVTVPASTTDMSYDIDFDHAKVLGVFLYSDVAVTLETNNSSSPAQTFALAANVPLVWVTGMPVADPFTTSVTHFYFTNATGGAATVRGRILIAA